MTNSEKKNIYINKNQKHFVPNQSSKLSNVSSERVLQSSGIRYNQIHKKVERH